MTLAPGSPDQTRTRETLVTLHMRSIKPGSVSLKGRELTEGVFQSNPRARTPALELASGVIIAKATAFQTVRTVRF